MFNTEIWDYSEKPRKLIRIIYNPHDRKPSEIMKEWILPEYWKDCKAYNIKIKR